MKKLLGALLCVVTLAIIAFAVIFLFRGKSRFQQITEAIPEASLSFAEDTGEAKTQIQESTTEKEADPDNTKIREQHINITLSAEEASETESETLPPRTEPIVLTFAGDILFDDSYAVMASMLQRGKGDKSSILTNSIDEELVHIMRDADIFMINNEFPYTDRGTPVPNKQYTFRAKPETAELLMDIGADIVSLANNHAYDYGEISLTDTLDTLENIGMPYVGAGRNIEEASRTVFFDVDGVRIAFISATQIEKSSPPDTKGATETSPGTFRCMNIDLLQQRIKEAKEESDFVVVYVHWGTEGTAQTDWLQDEQAPQIVKAGADLVIGDHPHVLQGIDYIDGVPVFYSLGNFLFNSKTLDSCLVSVGIDPQTADLSYVKFIPALQTGCRVKYLEGSEKQRVIGTVGSYSPHASIDAEGYVRRKE